MARVNSNEPWKDGRFRKQVIVDYINNKIDRKTASIKLHTSSTYISTLKKQYLSLGDQSLIHGNTGRECKWRICLEIEEELCNLYETIYYDFSYQHFCDWIRQSGELASIVGSNSSLPSDRTIARVLKRNGINSPEANKVRKGERQIHPLRPRRQRMGELVQIDASIHDWFQTGNKWTIYIAIDDATSIILAAVIAKTETTEGYFRLFRQIITNYGIPKTFYTDKRATFVFNGDKEVAKRARIHFDRACQTLGVDIIKTSIPEAKGRVERGFRSLQSRLVSELRILQIRTPMEAERYLLERFIPDHNKRCGKPPSNPLSAFRDLTPSELHNLDTILAAHHTRTILNGNVISYKHAQYMPIDANGGVKRLPGGEMVVVTDNGTDIKIIYDNAVYDTLKIRDGSTSSPPEGHPWRRWNSNKPNPRNMG